MKLPLLGIAPVAGVILAACGGDPGTSSPTPTLTAEHLALEATPLPGTDPLICVQGVGVSPEVELTAAEKIEDAMVAVRQGEYWGQMWDERDDRNTVLGCPPPKSFDTVGNRTFVPKGIYDERDLSEFDAWIYIYPDPLLRSYPFRLTDEQDSCSGDSCFQTGYGLYLAPTDICRTSMLVDILSAALIVNPDIDDWPQFASPARLESPIQIYSKTQSPTPTQEPPCF